MSFCQIVATFQIYIIRRKISSNCLPVCDLLDLIYNMKPDLHWNGNLKTVKIRIMTGHSLARFFFLCLSNCRPIHRKQLISVSENEIQLPQIYKHCCVEIVTLKSTCACLLSMSRADSLAGPLPCFWCLSLGSRNTQCRILEKKCSKIVCVEN